MTKICKHCGILKSTDDFYPKTRNSKTFYSYCKSCNRSKVAKWRETNPEKSKNNNLKWRTVNPKKVKGHATKWRETNPEKYKITTYRHSAKQRGLKLELTSDEMIALFHQDCFYCGSNVSDSLNGIDRLDSSVGYITNNVVPCCMICNKAKLNYSRRDFENWLERAYLHIKDRRSTVCPTLQ